MKIKILTLLLLAIVFGINKSENAAVPITINSIDIQIFDEIFVKLQNGQVLIGNRKLMTFKDANGNVLNTNIVYEFLGMPFAEPPLDQLRFKFPVKINSTLTQDVYNATYPRPACMAQYQAAFDAFFFNHFDEDCLYMNVWVPVSSDQDSILYTAQSLVFENDLANLQYIPNGFMWPSGAKASMFWIHGGGFDSGSSNQKYFNGDVLSATEGIIIASCNYRLAAFGFLYLSSQEAPGNAGLADQSLGIEFFSENYVAFFGGSTDKVTLFGESAGAMSVYNQIFSTKPKLFKRVIMQSADFNGAVRLPADSLQISSAFVQAIGCNDADMTLVINCLQTKNASAFTAIQNSYNWRPVAGDFNGFILNDFRDYNYSTALSQLDLDILLGFNQNEANFFAGSSLKGEVYFKKMC